MQQNLFVFVTKNAPQFLHIAVGGIIFLQEIEDELSLTYF